MGLGKRVDNIGDLQKPRSKSSFGKNILGCGSIKCTQMAPWQMEPKTTRNLSSIILSHTHLVSQCSIFDLSSSRCEEDPSGPWCRKWRWLLCTPRRRRSRISPAHPSPSWEKRVSKVPKKPEDFGSQQTIGKRKTGGHVCGQTSCPKKPEDMGQAECKDCLFHVPSSGKGTFSTSNRKAPVSHFR